MHCAAGRQIEAAMAWMAAVGLLQTQALCVQGEYYISAAFPKTISHKVVAPLPNDSSHPSILKISC